MRLMQYFLTLAYLLTFAVIPQGFMPVFSESGKVAIEICSGTESKTIFVDDQQNHDSEPMNECPYATLGNAHNTSTQPASILSGVKLDTIQYRAEQYAFFSSHGFHTPARAPPFFS